MKKTVLALIFILSCKMLLAQTPHPMDTIVGREPTYFYQFWFDSANFHNTTQRCKISLRIAEPTEIAKYNYTDSTLKVVGVAAYSMSEYVPDPPAPCYAQCADTSFDNWYENLILYKPTDTGMAMLASGPYNVRDTSRMMKLFRNQSTDSIEVVYLPIYEVYFDEPIMVTDSFYVATTNYHGVVDSQTMTYPGPHAYSCYYCSWYGGEGATCYPQRFMAKGTWNNFIWEYHYQDMLWLIFPIIDTTQPIPEVCEPPVGLHIQWQDSAGVLLAWEPDSSNRSWVVAYGPAVDDPEGYTPLATNSPEYTLHHLTPETEYAARVRAVCFDDNTYSEWGDTIHFTCVGNPVAIPSSEAPADGIRLHPNPARNEVTIHSDYPLRHVAVFDISGHKVLELTIHGRAARVPTHTLPSGNYIVNITTTRGTSSSKLTIE